jgi:hypothetical protein
MQYKGGFYQHIVYQQNFEIINAPLSILTSEGEKIAKNQFLIRKTQYYKYYKIDFSHVILVISYF